MDDAVGCRRSSESLDAVTEPSLPDIVAYRPVLTTIGDILKTQNTDKVLAVSSALQALSRKDLDAFACKHADNINRLGMWLANCEYTKRGVPPIFRNLPAADPDQHNLYLDLVAYDFEWLVNTYPKYVPNYDQWKKIVNPSNFHSQVKYFFTAGMNYGLRPAWKSLHGLGLSMEQQIECHCLKRERYFNGLHKLLGLMNVVENHLEYRYTNHVYKNESVIRLNAKDQEIIRRRRDIWYCGMLASWSPTQTGRLYDALTGYEDHGLDGKKPMSRQRALKFIEDVKRDLPKDFLKW